MDVVQITSGLKTGVSKTAKGLKSFSVTVFLRRIVRVIKMINGARD